MQTSEKLMSVALFCVACSCADNARPAEAPIADSGALDAAPADASKAGCAPLPSLSALSWRAPVRQSLDALIASKGCAASGYDAAAKPVALFDWDNTMIKNDVGDATMFWMLKNGKLRAPVGNDWATTSRYLSAAAKTRLNAVCGVSALKGGLLDTPANVDCTKEVLSIYTGGQTTNGAAAFAGFDARRMEPAYAWASALLSGYTEAQIYAFANQAIDENESAAIGATQTIAGISLTGYTRLYPEMKELVQTLSTAGFDVWVVSASAQPLVRAYAERAGIMNDHVIGIRSVADANGLWSAHLQGCGGVADGDDSVITYIDGKRCWINRQIYGDNTSGAWMRRPAARQTMAAGDSNTDVTFLRDATDLRLVINRNKEELMCFAYNNEDAHWLVQPMFISPRAERPALYPCASTACVNSQGAGGACIAESGAVIADQKDSVF